MYTIGCWLFWPVASFESSDGNWGDNEIPLKNRNLDSMVYFFELYKIKCNASGAILYRTTKAEYLNIFHWPSYLVEKKWSVPYKVASSHIKEGSFLAESKEHCFNGPQSGTVVNEAIKISKGYIQDL